MFSPHATEPLLPNKADSALAEASINVLASYSHSTKTPILQLVKGGKVKGQVTLPLSALQLLIDILGQIAAGNAVSLVPVQAELTTQEAADLLNVSRPYLVKLLKEGKLPYRKVGTKRRLLAKDIFQYKANIDEARLKVLDQLSEQAQQLKMGYEE